MRLHNIFFLMGLVISIGLCADAEYWGHLTTASARQQNSLPSSTGAADLLRCHAALHCARANQAYAPFNNPRACARWESGDYRRFLIGAFGYCCPRDAIPELPAGFTLFSADDKHCYFIPDSAWHALLEQWKLYEYPEFWSFIQQYHDYEQSLEKIFQKIQNDPHAKKQISKKASDRIHAEHTKIKHNQKLRSRAAQEAQKVRMEQEQQRKRIAAQRAQVQTNFSTQAVSLKDAEVKFCELAELCQEYFFGDVERFEKRLAALGELEQEGTTYKDMTYKLPQEVSECLSKFDCDPAAYTNFYGNQIQQVVHQDCIDLIGRVAVLQTDSPVSYYKEPLVECIDAARDYNHAGHTDKAITLTDFCASLLDYGALIISGAVDGVVGAVQDCLEHPIQTLACAVAGEYVLAYQLSKVVCNVAEIGITALIDSEKGAKKWRDYIEPVDKIIDAIANKQIGLRDAVKGGVQLAVHWKAQNKLLGSLGKLYKTTRTRVVEFAEKSPLALAEECAVTPEGFLLRASNSNVPGSSKVVQNGVAPIAPQREVVLPRVKTYEQARNQALKIIEIEKLPQGVPHIGALGVGEGKIVGQKWFGRRLTMRLDYDPEKGPHINIDDFRIGRRANGKKIAIPFDGDEALVASLLRPFNTEASLNHAKEIYKKVASEVDLFLISEAIKKLKQ